MLFFLSTAELEEHVERHGVSHEDAEFVVRNAQDPYPQDIGDGKLRVWGRTRAGGYLQVVFVLKTLQDVEWEQLSLPMLAAIWDNEAVFAVIIHAMPLTEEMKRKYRRQES